MNSQITPRTPIGVLLTVAAFGGRLGIAAGATLRMLLPPDAPAELKQAIRDHKVALIGLLELNFLIVHSATLAATVLWAPDSRTKQTLVAAGADPASVYTPDELAQLINKRVTVGELPAIHAARGAFHGRITEP